MEGRRLQYASAAAVLSDRSLGLLLGLWFQSAQPMAIAVKADFIVPYIADQDRRVRAAVAHSAERQQSASLNINEHTLVSITMDLTVPLVSRRSGSVEMGQYVLRTTPSSNGRRILRDASTLLPGELTTTSDIPLSSVDNTSILTLLILCSSPPAPTSLQLVTHQKRYFRASTGHCHRL